LILTGVSIEIQERVENWAHWCIEKTPRRACRSIEGRWRNDSKTDRPAFIVNPLDAVIIEDVMVGGISENDRLLLRAHYVYRTPVIEVRKHFGIRYGQYESEIARALRMVENRLRAMK
jgi:DNA-directed RNA polymerase specialized sigma24 family protein